jgi:hypothetical protein
MIEIIRSNTQILTHSPTIDYIILVNESIMKQNSPLFLDKPTFAQVVKVLIARNGTNSHYRIQTANSVTCSTYPHIVFIVVGLLTL